MTEPVTVVFFHFGDYAGRGFEYLATLRRMIMANLPEGYPGEFVCLTNDARFVPDGIRPIVQDFPNRVHEKMRMYSSQTIEPGRWCIYFDLDLMPVGPLDELFNWRGEPGEIGTLRDFWIPDCACPMLAAWRSGEQDYIWDSWVEAGKPTDTLYWDQGWTDAQIQAHGTVRWLCDEFAGRFRSYKAHCQQSVPDDAWAVCFHGDPRPHEVGGWVKHVRNGKTLVQALELVPNVTDSIVRGNVAIAESDLHSQWLKPAPLHDGHAVIVCGGPSLKDSVSELHLRAAHGQHIFACNGAHRWLAERDIPADLVLLDAQETSVKHCYALTSAETAWIASQCHPDAALVADTVGAEVVRWHAYRDWLDDGKRLLLGAGTTVGLQAIAVAWVLGYREFHIYGMDSCYSQDEHHAYPQAENDAERRVTVTQDDHEYLCAPWMAVQAQEFARLMEHMVGEGCTFTVHGTGLVPDIARQMAQGASDAGR